MRAGIVDLRVLIVDDDPLVARVMTKVLEVEGYREIAVAGSAAEAMTLAPSADLILLDHQLPDASGIDLLPRLQTLPNRPTILIVTAHGSESLAAIALRQGADDYVRKDESLRNLLPEVVERARRRRALRDAFTAAEADLVRAERMAAIGEMTVTMHHELNNPLMTAMAEADLLLGENGLNEDIRTAVSTIRGALDRMRTILRQAGELQRPDSTEYLQGLRMIDMHSQPRVARSGATRGPASVLLVDPKVAQVVGLLLRHAGFDVTALDSEADLPAVVKADQGLLVLAAPTLLGAQHLVLQPDRRLTVVALAQTDEEEDTLRKAADLVVLQPFDPATVVQDIVSIMRS